MKEPMATSTRKDRAEPYTTSPSERNLDSVAWKSVCAGDFALAEAAIVELWGSTGELERSRLAAPAPTHPSSLIGLKGPTQQLNRL